MPKMTAPTSAAPEFVDLVCADSAFVQAEFEAIVAANFPAPPPGDQSPRGGSGPPMEVPASQAWPRVHHHDAGSPAHAIKALRRQRSPPAPTVPFTVTAIGSTEVSTVIAGPAATARWGHMLRRSMRADPAYPHRQEGLTPQD
jgi:hypothetical protein